MRIGLVGLGRIGAFHAGTLAAIPDIDSLVVTDALPEPDESYAHASASYRRPSLDRSTVNRPGAPVKTWRCTKLQVTALVRLGRSKSSGPEDR